MPASYFLVANRGKNQTVRHRKTETEIGDRKKMREEERGKEEIGGGRNRQWVKHGSW